jgi:methylated-DNA-[protein]-cysteine S-methyltransferase
MISFIRMQSPLGELELVSDQEELLAISFPGAVEKKTPVLERTESQLREYFAGKRKRFDLPLKLTGTPFELAVWRELAAIPYGKTVTYGEVAKAIGNPKACRAVGMANHRNRFPVVISCHRVIGSDGKLTGYAGGLPAKIFLLNLESGIN